MVIYHLLSPHFTLNLADAATHSAKLYLLLIMRVWDHERNLSSSHNFLARKGH